jgi:hypothetical protein
MISLLHLLHAIAAERGDGLHPELRQHLPNLEAHKPDEASSPTQEADNLHHVNGAARLGGACHSKKRPP